MKWKSHVSNSVLNSPERRFVALILALRFRRIVASLDCLKCCLVSDTKRESSEVLAGTLMITFVTLLATVRRFLC